MTKDIPFFYRNKFIGNRTVVFSDAIQCGNYRHLAHFRKIEYIGPRYYAIYSCSLGHKIIRVRLNELKSEDVIKIKNQ